MKRDTATLQERFMQALASEKNELYEYIKPSGLISAVERFSVYQNNYREALSQVLGITYPVVKTVVGEAFFRAAAASYIAKHSPASTHMDVYGGVFSAFLKEYPPAHALSYLPDVAALEWCVHRSECAAPEAPLSADALASHPLEALAEMRFIPHASLMLFASEYGVDAIWRSAQNKTSPPENIHIDAPCFLAITTFGGVCDIRNLEPADYAMLRALVEGAPLMEAHEAVAQEYPDFTAEFALAICLKNHIVSGSFSGIK